MTCLRVKWWRSGRNGNIDWTSKTKTCFKSMGVSILFVEKICMQRLQARTMAIALHLQLHLTFIWNCIGLSFEIAIASHLTFQIALHSKYCIRCLHVFTKITIGCIKCPFPKITLQILHASKLCIPTFWTSRVFASDDLHKVPESKTSWSVAQMSWAEASEPFAKRLFSLFFRSVELELPPSRPLDISSIRLISSRETPSILTDSLRKFAISVEEWKALWFMNSILISTQTKSLLQKKIWCWKNDFL